MYQGKSFLAIIPARSGSKGLPHKNIKSLCGKPLIAWSIQSAQESEYIDEIVVTTDSQEYADIAKSYGASVPFLRPKELSQDTSATFDSIKHTIDFYHHELKKEFDYIVLLEPTSPLREAKDIDCAIHSLLQTPHASSIVGICKCENQHPSFLVQLNENHCIQSYINHDFKPIRRQELDQLYFFEGTLYICETQELLKHKNFYHHRTLGYEVPKWKSLEVDDEDDFIMIEAMMKKYILGR